MQKRRSSLSLSRLSLVLQAQGVTASRALAQALQISQPTLSRWLTQLGPEVERIGAARSSEYALRKNVRNLGSAWPLYRIDEKGRPHSAGELRALYGGFRLIPSGTPPEWLAREYPTGVFPDLPFFLEDPAPQGYLGRSIARAVAPNLGVPADPRDWRSDDILAYLLTEGDDLPGNFVLGDRALEQALRRSDLLPKAAIAESERASVYPERAAAAQRGEHVGSSAGGEQPKFLLSVSRPAGNFVPVIVKFSAAEHSPVSQRWADLLLCEHIAARILRAHGITSVHTEVLDVGGRRFLEVERFDRTVSGGRRGVVSLGSLEDGLVTGDATDWSASTARLETAGWLAAEQARELRWRWCFGDLIANTDMHRANTSFIFEDEIPFRLTPSYDMLPMFFAPGAQGDLSRRVHEPRPPTPALAPIWTDAAAAALEFWQTIAAEVKISPEFKSLGQTSQATVERMIARFSQGSPSR